MKKTEGIDTLINDVKGDVIGKKIVGIRYLTDKEKDASYWYKRCPILILEDGTQILPLSDDEGNESGVLEILPISGIQKVLPTI